MVMNVKKDKTKIDQNKSLIIQNIVDIFSINAQILETYLSKSKNVRKIDIFKINILIICILKFL